LKEDKNDRLKKERTAERGQINKLAPGVIHAERKKKKRRG
jgi:hypothetical protein